MSELRDNASEHRFEMDEQGLTSWAEYRRSDGLLTITYVYAPPELRGSGAAGRLMTAVAEAAKADGVKIVPVCGYAAGWLRASKTYRGLVA